MNRKYIIIAVVILAVIVGLYYYMGKKSMVEPTATQIANLEKHITNNNPEWKAAIEARAKAKGVSFAERLRKEVLSSLRESLNR